MTPARVAPAIVAVLVAAACVFLARAWPLAAAAEDRLADLRAAAFAPHLPAQHPRVALVLVTEDTLAELPYRSPVDRALLAAAVNALAGLGVAGLGIDILFDRASEPEKDAVLVAALKAFPAPVVLASADVEEGLSPAQVSFLDSFISAAGAARAVPALHVDADGAVRRWPGGAPSFAVALAGEGARPPESGARIAFLGPPEDGADVFAQLPIHALPALAALNRAALEAALKGKVVLLGADLPGIDRHRTPLAARAGASADMAGVEVHAHMLAQALDGRRVGEAGPAAAAFLLALAVAGVLLAHWERPGPVRAGALGVVLVVLWGGAALAARENVLVPLAMPTLALLGAHGIESARAHRAERVRRRQIRDAFARYVPPAVVAELSRHPERLALGGERRELTVLFTDVEGFTAYAESLAPQDLAAVLNAYLDGASRAVLAAGGTIDKFVGDAVVAFFSAPIAQPDHARRALDAARAIDAFGESFRVGHPGFGRTRVGVHTGTAVVGNFGGEGRFDYTAMGDTVNVAARLESANKHFGTHVLASGHALAAAGAGAGVARPVADVVFKGRTEALAVFELLPETEAAWAGRCTGAHAMMASGDEGADGALQALAEERPDDKVIALHRARRARGERGVRVVLEEK